MSPDLQNIINLRHTIHRYPELSNLEFETSQRISEFFQAFNPDQELQVSETGRMFVFDSGEEGPCVVFRTELDALPIQEESELGYRSVNEGVAHLCGHDGHMAIQTYLAKLISEKRPKRGKAVILFQPAEENFLGARDVCESLEFQQLHPDYIFATHNIPGTPKNLVLAKEGSFTAASKGLTLNLKGITSHAAEPELGKNPIHALNKIYTALNNLIQDSTRFQNTTFLTFIYIRLGEIAFGVSPDEAEVGITLRAFENEDMIQLTEQVELIINRIAEEEELDYSINYDEIYPATLNDPGCVEIIKDAAKEIGLSYREMEEPFKWSEDFAYFTATNKGAQFGFGAGEELPNLHNPFYDFPDDIIEPAGLLFFKLYEKLLC
jgi:amidohydrolase